MSKNFKTTQQKKDDELKYHLMRMALNTTKFYKDGEFDKQMESTLSQEPVPQSYFYSAINDLALKLGSDTFKLTNAQGDTFSRQTQEDIKKFYEKLTKGLQQGLLSPEVYTNLASYAKTQFNTAMFSNKRTTPTDKQKPIVSLINKSIQSIPLVSLEQELQQQRLTQQADSSMIQGQLDNLQKTAQQYLMPKTSDKVTVVKDTKNGDHPSQGLESIREGERNINRRNVDRYSDTIYKSGDMDQHPDQKIKSMEHYLDVEFEKEKMSSERYGLTAKQYDNVHTQVLEIIENMITNNKSLNDVQYTLSRFVRDMETRFPSFQSGKFFNNYIEVFERANDMKNKSNIERINAILSKETAVADDMLNSHQARQQFDSNQDGTMPVPKHTKNAQASASYTDDLGQLNFQVQNLDDMYFTHIVLTIESGEIPTGSNDEATTEGFSDLNKYFDEEYFSIFYKKNVKELMPQDLIYIKSLPSVSSFRWMLTNLKKINPSDNHDFKAKQFMIEELNKLLRMVEGYNRDFPMMAKLKNDLDITTENEEKVYARFLNQQFNGKGKQFYASGQINHKRKGDVEPLPPAIPAMTARVAQSSNNYIVGDSTYIAN